MSTEEKIQSLIDAWVERQRSRLLDELEVLVSPIERLFLLAMLERDWDFAHDWDSPSWKRDVWALPGISVEACTAVDTDAWLRSGGVGRLIYLENIFGPDSAHYAITQLPVETGGGLARIDFAFILHGVRVAVELDGHDFHERTKEQARKEKSRQRRLTAAGWHVLRFTGSEVYADADKCVDEVECLPSTLWRSTR